MSLDGIGSYFWGFRAGYFWGYANQDCLMEKRSSKGDETSEKNSVENKQLPADSEWVNIDLEDLDLDPSTFNSKYGGFDNRGEPASVSADLKEKFHTKRQQKKRSPEKKQVIQELAGQIIQK